jgi:hypothetical protein
LDPRLSKDTVATLDKSVLLSRTLDGKQYICGVVGLNNINSHDHINTVLQALAHLPSFRDFWLDPSNYLNVRSKTYYILILYNTSDSFASISGVWKTTNGIGWSVRNSFASPLESK